MMKNFVKKRFVFLTVISLAVFFEACALPSGVNVRAHEFALFMNLTNILGDDVLGGENKNLADQFLNQETIKEQIDASIKSSGQNKSKGIQIDNFPDEGHVWWISTGESSNNVVVDSNGTQVNVTDDVKTYVLYYPAVFYKGKEGFSELLTNLPPEIKNIIDWDDPDCKVPANIEKEGVSVSIKSVTGVDGIKVPDSDESPSKIEFDFPNVGEAMSQLRGFKIQYVYVLMYLKTNGLNDAGESDRGGEIQLNITGNGASKPVFDPVPKGNSDHWCGWREDSALKKDGDITTQTTYTGKIDFADYLTQGGSNKFEMTLKDIVIPVNQTFADISIDIELAIVLPLQLTVDGTGKEDNTNSPFRKDVNGGYFRQIDISEFDDMKDNIDEQLKDLQDTTSGAGASITQVKISLSNIVNENFINGLKICVQNGVDENAAWEVIDLKNGADAGKPITLNKLDKLPRISLGVACTSNGFVTEPLKVPPPDNKENPGETSSYINFDAVIDAVTSIDYKLEF